MSCLVCIYLRVLSEFVELRSTISNCLEGKDGFTFMSEISKMPNLFLAISRSILNLLFKI